MTRASLLAVIALSSAVPAGAQEYPRTPPPPGPLTPAPFPPVREAVLPNGLRILVVENHKQPIVSLSLSFHAGEAHDPVGREGLAEMTAGLLTKGAGDRTADQIAETIEGAGGSLTASTGSDFMSVNATVLTPSLGLAFELLADVVMRPTFPDPEIELLRTQTLSALQVQLSQPDAIAGRAFQQALWGAHPYGRSQTPESVRAIGRDDLVTFHRMRLRPDGALLVLAGDVSLDHARRLAGDAFRNWTGRPAAAQSHPTPAGSGTELILVHRPGSVQSNILVGNLGFRADDPRHYAATAVNRLLGGGAASRLFLILREQKSWTYGAYSSLVRRADLGYFVASAEVRTEVTDSALGELLAQLSRVRAEPVPETELEAAKGAIVGSYPLSIETASQVAAAVANARLYGLPDDYVQTYRVRVGAVTALAAREAAQAMIRPDQATIVVVGDGTRVYESIRDLAPIRIVDPEGRPLSPEDLSGKAVALEFDPARLAPGRDSFAIMVQGAELGFQSSTLERIDDGFRYVEETRIGGFVEQTTEILTDPRLQIRRVTQTGTIQGQQSRIEVIREGDRVRGTATTPTPEGMRTVTIDTTVAEGVLEENLVTPVLPALGLESGALRTFTVFSSASGETRQLTLTAGETEEVSTPAGTATTRRVELTGGPQPATFWVTIEAPHRIMKITIAGTPIEIVRAAP